MQLIPDFIQRKIAHRPNLIKIVDNIGWLFIDRFLRMGVGLLVGVWVARYLGPAQYGLLNYALAFVALFGAIATLGLKDIVVRDLVRQPATGGVTLGTAFVLRLIGGFGAFVLIVSTMAWLRPGDVVTKTMVAILGFSLVFKASEVISYWFESQVQSKYVVWITNSVFFLVAGIKVMLILNEAPLIVFVWLVLFEAILAAVAMIAGYMLYEGSLRIWSFQARRATALIRDSWPLILSGIAVMIYMRIDQIMLGDFLGSEAVGVYSAALRISEVWFFVPLVVVSSVFPSVVNAKKRSDAIYYKRLQKLYDLLVFSAVAIALPVSLSSGWIVQLLYGEAFIGASLILSIHVWGACFVFLGVASGNWLLLENLQKHAFYRTGLGALVNIVLNIFLIPEYGGVGAATATIFSQVVAAYIYDVFNVETRKSFWLKTRSLLPFTRAMRQLRSW
ncbi:MAG: flippase [Gammaproteobacteria bacterium]|nr:MAG: flippase [Gammaproteobacteria bacterium]